MYNRRNHNNSGDFESGQKNNDMIEDDLIKQ